MGFIQLLYVLLSTAYISAEGSDNPNPAFICEFHKRDSSLDIYYGFTEEQVKECLRNYSSAETLTLRFSKLKIVPYYLNILKGLVNLDLSNNEIHAVDFNTRNLTGICKNLKTINLNFNSIRSLDSGTLNCLQSIEKFYIGNNNLTIIENGTFSERLKALTHVYLVNNSLTVLDSSLISKVLLSDKIFIGINASWNKIRTITNSINLSIEDISNSTELVVTLVHNNITTADVDYYRNMFHVTDITQFYNLWNSAFDTRFNPFICDCRLYRLAEALRLFYPMGIDNPVFSTTCGSPVSLAGMLIRKVPLNQFNCSVSQDCPRACACTKTIETDLIKVDCGKEYPIHDLPEKCPQATTITLIISSDNLTSLSPTSCLQNYTLLDVSLSAVKNINPLFVNMVEGRTTGQIYLHDNNLEAIPKRFEKFNFSKGQILTLHNNPFNCDCNLLWMKKWLLTNTHYVPYQEKIICEFGLGQGKPVVKVPDNKFVCQKNLSLKSILAMTVGPTVLVVLLLTFAVYKRKTIQVFMIQNVGFCKYCCREKIQRSLQYDIFIPHSCEDDPTVTEIVNTLESMTQPYSVCIGERNFAVGKTISENILTAIESSQTTLLVISNNFLRSAWCNMEFREAHMRFLKDRNIRLVLILLEELDSHLIYEELRYYMESHVYINYNDKQFWGKLLQSLPVVIPNDDVSETSPLV